MVISADFQHTDILTRQRPIMILCSYLHFTDTFSSVLCLIFVDLYSIQYTYWGTSNCRFSHNDWMNHVPSFLSLKEAYSGMVAMPSRKSASAGMEFLGTPASVESDLGRGPLVWINTTGCSLMPWHAWMKKSLGFSFKEGQWFPEKGSVSCLSLTWFPSTP